MTCSYCEKAVTILSLLHQVPKPKSKLIKGDQTGQDVLEMLACDRKSQSGNKNSCVVPF